jgi:hypothetical protein
MKIYKQLNFLDIDDPFTDTILQLERSDFELEDTEINKLTKHRGFRFSKCLIPSNQAANEQNIGEALDKLTPDQLTKLAITLNTDKYWQSKIKMAMHVLILRLMVNQ